MDLLRAVNSILPKLGEHAVTNLSLKHPTLAIILPVIETTLDSVLLRGWWFNEFAYKVFLEPEGEAPVPVDTLEFLPDEEGPVVRGGRFFNTLDNSFVFDAPFEGRLKVRVPFEEVPESIAYLVLYTALVEVYVTDIGLEAVVQEWQNKADVADAQACSEHLRNRRYSTKKSHRYGRIRSAMRG
jgi:hypothetical protein